MKKINVFYWICIAVLMLGMGVGGIADLVGNPSGEEVMRSLGYPVHLSKFLAVAKLLGLAAIIAPVTPRLKEWAYAGLAFDVMGAIYSIIAAGLGVVSALIPVLVLCFLFGAYFLHHKRRRYKDALPVMA